MADIAPACTPRVDPWVGFGTDIAGAVSLVFRVCSLLSFSQAIVCSSDSGAIPGACRIPSWFLSAQINLRIDSYGEPTLCSISSSVSFGWLAVGIGCILGAVVLNRADVRAFVPYFLLAAFCWLALHESGVHATLAGVLVALTIPMQARHGGHVHSPLEHLIHGLHPWVAFMILPIFAFANAGVAVAGLSLADLASPLPLGIALGLFVGKQIGVLGFTWLAVRSRLCRLPRGVDWAQIYGVACLCGVGFTMSLFIGTLAFDDAALMDGVRLGVLMGSSLSAVVGYLVLRGVAARRTVGATLPA